MFGHYIQGPVATSYLVTLVAAIVAAIKGIPAWAFLPMASMMLWWIDRMVHQRIHPQPLALPSMSLLVVAAIIAASTAGYIQGWGTIGAVACQGIWDNSWHSRTHHRDTDARADTDHWGWRLGSASCLFAAFVHGIWMVHGA
jgi:hypothetical protein